MRRSPLKRRAPLRARRRSSESNPARHAFKEVVWFACDVCGKPGWVRRHHVTLAQHVRAEGGDEWDVRNSMFVGVEGVTCNCHERHHSAACRIPLPLVPDSAVAFCVDLFGSDERAAMYLARHYAPEVDDEGWVP